jgi:hypothetical protein
VDLNHRAYRLMSKSPNPFLQLFLYMVWKPLFVA